MSTNLAVESKRAWAQREFGGARLGNLGRTKRLVAMGARAAGKPGGKLTEVFTDPAQREGAYRFLENDEVDPQAIGHGVGVACAERCRDEEFVFVPVDGSSLSLPDPNGVRGLGAVGTHTQGQHGLLSMSAIAVCPDGTPAGLLAQRLWARERRRVKKHRRQRRLHEKETQHWLHVVQEASACWQEAGAQGRLWFQLDRGGDFWEMLRWAAESEHWVTVRAAHNRLIAVAPGHYLSPYLARRKPLGYFELDVPAGRKRCARRGRFVLRAARVTLWVRARPSKKRIPVELGAVWAREVRTTPRGEKPLEWMLLTTAPMQTFAEAQRVVFGYTRRWRIEEFHKTWKSTCGIEQTQLRGADRIRRWSIILAAVATRIQRLTYLARNAPETPATEELTPDEVDAVVLLKDPKHFHSGNRPTIGQAVLWIAQLGGYTGKSSGGPPGAITIGRGLEQVCTVATAIRNLRGTQ